MRKAMSVLMVLVLSIHYVSSAYSGSYGGTLPVCTSNPSGVGLTINPVVQGSQSPVLKITYYYDSTNLDNVELRIDDATANTYTITASGRSLSQTGNARTIPKASGDTVAVFYQKLIVIKSSTSTYNVYWFDSTGTGALTAMPLVFPTSLLSTGTLAYLRFASLYQGPTNVDVHFYLSGNADQGFYKVIITKATPAITTTLAVTTADGGSQAFASDVWGSQIFMIDQTTGMCWLANGTPQFVGQGTCQITTPTDYTINDYRIQAISAIVAIKNSDHSGNIYYANVATKTLGSFVTLPADTGYRTYTDNIRNLLVLPQSTGKTVFWMSVKVDGTVLTSTLTSNAQAIFYSASWAALANHRAFLLQSTSFSIVEMSASDNIKLISTIAMTPADAFPTALSSSTLSEYKISISCIRTAPALVRFTCFATTLGCITTINNVSTDLTTVQISPSV